MVIRHWKLVLKDIKSAAIEVSSVAPPSPLFRNQCHVRVQAVQRIPNRGPLHQPLGLRASSFLGLKWSLSYHDIYTSLHLQV